MRTMSDTSHSNLFVAADGQLAEYLCCAEVFELTTERAAQLRTLHAEHNSTECHVLAAVTQYSAERHPE